MSWKCEKCSGDDLREYWFWLYLLPSFLYFNLQVQNGAAVLRFISFLCKLNLKYLEGGGKALQFDLHTSVCTVKHGPDGNPKL